MKTVPQDPRFIPAYSIPEAAHYLRLPETTARAWSRGMAYRTPEGTRKRFRAVIDLPDPDSSELSFVNLVELHVLFALRRRHRVPMPAVRKALDFVKREFKQPHPLATEEFETDGIALFVTRFGKLINASKSGQTELRELISTHLSRIDHDKTGLAERLFPFVRSGFGDQPKPVVIDPRVSFGRPVVEGTGAPTAEIAQRYKAGESIGDLSHDFGLSADLVEEAVRCELDLAAA